MYKVKITSLFALSSKKLKKKYPKIKKDLTSLVQQLKQGVLEGNKLQGFVKDVYKVRVASIDQKKGKSGGFRVVYYAVIEDKKINLIFIYAKAKQTDLTTKQKNKLKEFIEILKNQK